MKSGNRALPMLLPVVLLYTAVSCQASETKRLRQQCIDDCRIETSTCTTNCQTGDCVKSCTLPLSGCIKNCRKLHPRQTRSSEPPPTPRSQGME